VTGLLEREHELAALDGALADARTGRGCLVVVEAAAGLGKTRLLQAARERAAAAGLSPLAARATELELTFPFALARQLFGPSLASLPDGEREALLDGAAGAARGALGLGAAGDRPADPFAVLHGLYWLTAVLAEREPLLLAIDDAHWADPASLDFLGFLLPRLEELPVAVVVAFRPGEGVGASALARLSTDDAARRLEPAALGDAAAEALLTAELGTAPAPAFTAVCRELSGGNPFLLCELARTVRAQAIAPTDAEVGRVRELAPERVARTVLLRLARLSPEAQAVARAVVVLGDDPDPRLVAAFAELDPGAVAQAADALRSVVILEAAGPLRFVHPLVRTALDAELPRGERAGAHARAVGLLRAAGAPPERLASHLLATEPSGEPATVEALLAGARRALADGAPASAIAYLLRALREPPAGEVRAAVIGSLTTAVIRASDHATWAEVEAEVLAEFERTPALKSRCATAVSAWLALRGRFDEAVALLESAIEVAVAQDDVDRAFRLEGQLGTLAQLPVAEASARLRRYDGRIPAGSAAQRLDAAFRARWAIADGSAEEAVAFARRALGADGRIFREQSDVLAPSELIIVLLLAERFDEARRGLAHAFAHARERNAIPEQVAAWMLSAGVPFFTGALDEAEADMRQALHLATLGGMSVALPAIGMMLALILAFRGEAAAAEEQLAAMGATGEIPDLPLLNLLLFIRAMLRFDQGRPGESAADALELLEREQRWVTSVGAVVPVRAVAVRALVALGERERALALAAAELAEGRRWGTPGSIAMGLCAMGTATGGSEGIALLQEAVAVGERSGMLRHRATALLALGSALRRANRRADAREPLRRGLEVARRHGATGLAKSARDELLACGERVRRHTPLGAASLTPSERRVAEMAAGGLTNRQIAQRLYLTVKTIETHLGAAYDKLGIRSRRELAQALGASRPDAAGC
jgi:DNA-binding CsgD family transcriptional regulator/tetratricopeptide (TPR) repeat protein